jgi:ubiquitin C
MQNNAVLRLFIRPRPHGAMKVYVKGIHDDSEMLTLEVVPSDTILQLKIEAGLRSSLDEVKMIYTGMILDDTDTVSQCRIRSESVLHYVLCLPGQVQLFVKDSETQRTAAVSIKSTDDLQAIKWKIQAEFGYPVYKQRLAFEGRSLPNSIGHTLFECGITKDCTIELTLSPFTRPLFVKSFRNVHAIEYVGSNSIYDIKAMILYAEGMFVSRQRLVFAGKSLDDARTLIDYNIKEESTIFLLARLRG